MAAFYASTGRGGANQNVFLPSKFVATDWPDEGAGSQRAVLADVAYSLQGADLEGLVRTVTYGGVPMTSLGVVALNNVDGDWVEVFGLLDVPPGKGSIVADVRRTSSFALPHVYIRGNSFSYTGVESFGTVGTEYGTGTSLSMSATGPNASKVHQCFAARAGLTEYNRAQRYSGSAGIALVSGDADGTGSSMSFTAKRASSGTWAGISVVLNPADVIATAEPVIAQPVLSSSGRRLSRPGTNRRTVFTVPVED